MSAPSETLPKSVGWAARIAKAPWQLIGVALLIVVLANVDLKQVLSQLAQIGVWSVVATGLAFLNVIAVRCWRWRVLTLAVGTQQPFWQLVASCNRSIWLGLATPGRVGEFRRAADLSVVRGWSLVASGSLVFFDLLIDLGVYASMGFGGLLYLILPGHWAEIGGIGVVTAAAGVLLNLGLMARQLIRGMPVLLRVPGLSDVLPALGDGLRGSTNALLVVSAVLSAGAHVLLVWCLIAPILPNLSLIQLTAGIGLTGVAGAIPITYFGLGTRDVMLLWFFSQIGQSAADAITLSLSFIPIQLIGILVSLATGPLLGWLARRSSNSTHAG